MEELIWQYLSCQRSLLSTQVLEQLELNFRLVLLVRVPYKFFSPSLPQLSSTTLFHNLAPLNIEKIPSLCSAALEFHVDCTSSAHLPCFAGYICYFIDS